MAKAIPLLKPCRHVISLRNLAATTSAYKVRVSAYTPTTQILSSSVPPGWTQKAQYPTHVTWRRTNGGPIPSGNPLPGAFAIHVQNDAQKDKRVLVEWLPQGDLDALCRQILRVGCGKYADYEPDNPVPDNPDDRARAMPAPPSAFCRCLSAETASDEDSDEVADPDLEVELGTPIPAGFHKVIIPYTIEVEPPQLQFTREWEVTVTDELGDEQPISVPFSDNLTGQATFTLPEAGDYDFYLTVTDPATCVSARNRDPDELSTAERIQATGAE